MRVIFVPSRDFDAFLATGEVRPDYPIFREDRRLYLRPVDMRGYAEGLLRSGPPDLRTAGGRAGRMYLWWEDDFQDGECDLEETLVPVSEWIEGVWAGSVDAMVVEALNF